MALPANACSVASKLAQERKGTYGSNVLLLESEQRVRLPPVCYRPPSPCHTIPDDSVAVLA